MSSNSSILEIKPPSEQEFEKICFAYTEENDRLKKHIEVLEEEIRRLIEKNNKLEKSNEEWKQCCQLMIPKISDYKIKESIYEILASNPVNEEKVIFPFGKKIYNALPTHHQINQKE